MNVPLLSRKLSQFTRRKSYYRKKKEKKQLVANVLQYIKKKTNSYESKYLALIL